MISSLICVQQFEQGLIHSPSVGFKQEIENIKSCGLLSFITNKGYIQLLYVKINFQ